LLTCIMEKASLTQFAIVFTQYNVFNFAPLCSRQQMSASVTNSALITRSFFPIVTIWRMRRWYAAEKEGEWVKYSISKQGWVEESKRLKRNPLWTLRPTLRYPSRSGTHLLRPRPSRDQVCYQDGRQVPETIVPGQVLTPIWQVIPAAFSAVNVNLLSDEE
jgi:hypothetical protein